jgi:hypothetical protein
VSCAELFTTQEPIEPKTITLAEAMDHMEYTTPDYNLTGLDCNLGPTHIASISTAVTIPAQTLQVRQPGSSNIFLQGSSGGRESGGILGRFLTGGGGGGSGGGGGGGGGGPLAPAPAPAAAPTQNNDP